MAVIVALALAAIYLVQGSLLPSHASTEKVLVVDQLDPAAADTNSGTASAPFKTIQAALTRADLHNREGVPVRVVIKPGMYRESLSLGRSGSRTSAPLTIAGEGADRVVVAGSDRWTGWTQQADGTWTAPWPYRWGLSPTPSSAWDDYLARKEVSDLIRRREAVFVDGRLLRQVLTARELTAGTFFVDEATGRLIARPESGVSLDTAKVEVSVRDRLLDVQHWSNLTVRGITFRHAANGIQGSAVRFLSGSNLRVEDARVEWSNWTGMAFQHSTDVTVRRVSTSDNGVMGISSYKGERMTFEDVENSRNNTWRGAWSNWYGWETGAKFFRLRGATFTRWHAVDNAANGIWFDTDVSDVSVTDSFFARNARRGMFLEAVQGPFLLEGNTVCRNLDHGVVDGKANDVTLVGNRLFDNAKSQLIFSGTRGGRTITTWTGQTLNVRSERWTIRGNVLQGSGTDRLIGNNMDDADWVPIRSSIAVSDNAYHHPEGRRFTLPSRVVDFPTWRADVGETGSSTTTTPAALTCDAPRPKVPPAAPAAYEPSAGTAPATAGVLQVSGTSGGTTTTNSMVLTRNEKKANSSSWTASVVINVVDGKSSPLPHVAVTGRWSHDGSTQTCTTGSDGTCTVSAAPLTKSVKSSSFTVSEAVHATHTPAAGALPLEIVVLKG